jgi:hypothetical protein
MFTGGCTAVSKRGNKSVSGMEIALLDQTVPSAPRVYAYLPILFNFLSGK